MPRNLVIGKERRSTGDTRGSVVDFEYAGFPDLSGLPWTPGVFRPVNSANPNCQSIARNCNYVVVKMVGENTVPWVRSNNDLRISFVASFTHLSHDVGAIKKSLHIYEVDSSELIENKVFATSPPTSTAPPPPDDVEVLGPPF